MRIIERIQENVAELKRSKEVAKRGLKIRHDTIDLCICVLVSTNKADEIEEFAEDTSKMSKTPNETAVKSKAVAGSFVDVRQGLYAITTDIPSTVERLEEGRSEETRKSTAFEAVVGDIVLVACPPALILPAIALPLISLVVEAFVTRVKRIATRSWEKNSQDSAEVLYKVSKDLAQFDDCIDNFAGFWAYMELLLDGVKGRIDELRMTGGL
ncbi:hypothetical protein NLJ89_g1320 [Agrocybe chaxingu]|uniref:Uncharacterized protein n=1 Tax=Agrocybe chaxingu TaxID=84603 RepID=A0A9W8TEM4_9AGAR|nr:hypothetical protein NLJ89_g1320 [Agrocybe chaxingu]